VADIVYLHLAPQDPATDDGPACIDGVQNGLLLAAQLHLLWDSWMLSINPVKIPKINVANP